jgi:hypothetical protein
VATVRIGERDLEVKKATLGFLKHKLIPARKRLNTANEEEMPDRVAELVLCYVDGNEGVDRDWLLDNLPADPSEAIRDCIVASGQTPKAASAGEAARP